MVLREIGAYIRYVFGSWFGLQEPKHKFDMVKIAQYIVIAVGAIAIIAGAFFIYRWNVVHKEKMAQKQFALAYQEFIKAEKSQEGWLQVATQFNNGATTHAGTTLAPYFNLYQAEALLRAGNGQEARAAMNSVIDKLSNNAPFANLFKIKRALMMLDAQDEKVQQDGLADLIVIARDKNAAYNDTALFYLGKYYWATNNVAQAQETWQDLVLSQRQEKLAPSPWASVVEPYLKQIAA